MAEELVEGAGGAGDTGAGAVEGAGTAGQGGGDGTVLGGEGAGAETWLDTVPEAHRESLKGYESWEAMMEALKPPVVPEGDYAIPEALAGKVDADNLKAFMPVAKELGLTQEAMEKLLAYDVERMGKLPDQIKAAHQTQLKEGQVALATEVGQAKYDGMVADAHRAMRTFADESVSKWMNDTGQGDNPILLKFMAKIGAALGEDTPKGGSPGGGDKPSTAQVLFPSMPNP